MAEIQEYIDELRNESHNQEFLRERKLKTIKDCTDNLEKIRKAALFLGDMSEMHKQKIKKQKKEQTELEEQ